MAAQLTLVEPSLGGQLAPLDCDGEPLIIRPEPSDFSGLLVCANGDCGKVLQFKAGRAQCGGCGVDQIVVD